VEGRVEGLEQEKKEDLLLYRELPFLKDSLEEIPFQDEDHPQEDQRNEPVSSSADLPALGSGHLPFAQMGSGRLSCAPGCKDWYPLRL